MAYLHLGWRKLSTTHSGLLLKKQWGGEDLLPTKMFWFCREGERTLSTKSFDHCSTAMGRPRLRPKMRSAGLVMNYTEKQNMCSIMKYLLKFMTRDILLPCCRARVFVGKLAEALIAKEKAANKIPFTRLLLFDLSRLRLKKTRLKYSLSLTAGS